MMDGKLTRRGFVTAAAGGGTLCGWLGRLAAFADDQRQPKSCILLWMAGGPSHLDTFDLKPEASNKIRGDFRPIKTSVPGIQISEHFPRFAQRMRHAAILRGMNTVESDHQLASYHLHTGYQKRAGGIAFPTFGSIVSRELGRADFALPSFVCIGSGSRTATRSGFFGPAHQPLDVTDPERGTNFLEPLGDRAEFERRYSLLQRFESNFERDYQADAGRAHSAAVSRAVRLMNSEQ